MYIYMCVYILDLSTIKALEDGHQSSRRLVSQKTCGCLDIREPASTLYGKSESYSSCCSRVVSMSESCKISQVLGSDVRVSDGSSLVADETL